MKKVLFLLFTIVAIYGCKNTEEQKTQKSQSTEMKTAYNDEDIIYELAKLLREKDDSICPLISNMNIDKLHAIDTAKYNNYLKNFYGSKANYGNIKHQPIKWSQFKKLVEGKCYDKYIAFNCDFSKKDNNDIAIKTIDTFTLKEPCYSKALFKVLENNNVTDNTEFYFSKAKNDNGNNIIIFTINDSKGIPMVFEDLSQNPTIIIDIFKYSYLLQNQK